MTRGRLALVLVVGLVICLGLGFTWGASGRRVAETALEDTRLQLHLAEARGALLDGRVALYNHNYGDAARRFEQAKRPLREVRARYQEARRNDAAASIDAAVVHLDEAQRLAGQLDPSANTRAIEALEAIRVATEK